jgi:hypothetical protein
MLKEVCGAYYVLRRRIEKVKVLHEALDGARSSSGIILLINSMLEINNVVQYGYQAFSLHVVVVRDAI